MAEDNAISCNEFSFSDEEEPHCNLPSDSIEKNKQEEIPDSGDESDMRNVLNEEKEEDRSVLSTMERLKSMAVTVPMNMMSGLFDSTKKEECEITPRTTMTVIRLNLKPQGESHESACKTKGETWTSDLCSKDDEIFVMHDPDAVDAAVTYDMDASVASQTSGITGGTLQIVSGLMVNPLKGASDLFIEPYQHLKADPSLESAGKGLLKGTKSLLMAPLNVITDTLGGTKKIVDGIWDTPQNISNLAQGLTFNKFSGWTTAYSVSGLNEFPGEVGDILVVDWHVSTYYMLKLDSSTVLRSRRSKIEAIKNTFLNNNEEKSEVGISTLEDIQQHFQTGVLSIIDAKYCIIRNQTRSEIPVIHKALNSSSIIHNALNYFSQPHSSSSLFSNYSCQFCFACRYDTVF